MRRKLLLCIAAAAILTASMTPAGASTKTVTIPARRFDPQKVTIFMGDTVQWVNTDDRKHSVTATSSAEAKGEDFDSNPNCPGIIFSSCLTHGETYSHTFTHSGVFTYYCRIHGSDTSFAACDMCGQVIVKKKGGAVGSASPSVSPSISPSTSPSASPTDGTVSPSASASPSGLAAGDTPSEDRTGLTVAIASAAVVLLAGSGLLVYRTLLRR